MRLQRLKSEIEAEFLAAEEVEESTRLAQADGGAAAAGLLLLLPLSSRRRRRLILLVVVEHDVARDHRRPVRFVRDGRAAEVDIPGDDPEVVCEGRPWVSRRLYVEGSSWLYGYALNAIERQFTGED